ncbi:hypothetical protein L1049_024452 [Liquidambar formosana]|uniref:O-methyltransferase C-terminal domain-containing protein n=1 Tax=Liquidambar formosana TaxID=63359 RepID=A0AAP0WZL9_LIQFO
MLVKNHKGDEESMETQLFFDMLMMVLVTGRERNEREWAKLFSDAGFTHYKITPILGLSAVTVGLSYRLTVGTIHVTNDHRQHTRLPNLH